MWDGCRVSGYVGDPGCNKGSSLGAARTYGDQGRMSSQCRGRGACILVGLTPVRQGRAQPMQTPSAPPLWLCVQHPYRWDPLPLCLCPPVCAGPQQILGQLSQACQHHWHFGCRVSM